MTGIYSVGPRNQIAFSSLCSASELSYLLEVLEALNPLVKELFITVAYGRPTNEILATISRENPGTRVSISEGIGSEVFFQSINSNEIIIMEKRNWADYETLSEVAGSTQIILH